MLDVMNGTEPKSEIESVTGILIYVVLFTNLHNYTEFRKLKFLSYILYYGFYLKLIILINNIFKKTYFGYFNNSNVWFSLLRSINRKDPAK